jgi:hypothetical protein
MQLFSWFHKRMTGRPHTRRTPARKPSTSFRPQLEVLEGREVPSTLKVTNLGDSGQGSLRYEIAAAHSGDTIVIEKSGTIQLSSGYELYIGKNLSIQGPGAGKLTITSYYKATRIFEVRAASVTLSGMTIRNGGGNASSYYSSYNDGYGGAILNDFGTLTISGCVLTGNSAGLSMSHGGGMANFGTLVVTGCTLSNNSATDVAGYGLGGGIFNEGTLTVSGCTFSGNAASQGGGIYNSGTATVSGCTLSGNSANDATLPDGTVRGQGGAIYNVGTMRVSGCTLTGNSAFQAGGGIYNAGTLTVSDSYFSRNTPDNIFGPYTDAGGNAFS